MPFQQKLGNKIIGILLTFFVVALLSIGMTLLISWQLEGGAAAINDAGSERMHSYRIAYLLTRSIDSSSGGVAGEKPETAEGLAYEASVRDEIRNFEQILQGLETGDPTRPLFLPRTPEVQAKMALLRNTWYRDMKPRVEAILASRRSGEQTRLAAAYHPLLLNYVDQINDLVLLIEHSNAGDTALLRSFQLGLVALALFGTIALIYLFFLLVIRPVATLHEGIKRMALADFSVRLPVETQDEFGELAQGFNQMADRLENLYATLEQRVEGKTISLESKNLELAMLYEVAAFLNEPATQEEMCGGVLRKMIGLFGADGGTVRLTDENTGLLHVVVQEGMSESFLSQESRLSLGECLCGETAQSGAPVSWDLRQVSDRPLLYRCKRDGFDSVVAVPIRLKKQILGIINLFYRQPRQLPYAEIRLLETVGRHLGVAIENHRLASCQREVAISEERNLLAQELHDSIAQSLAFLNIQVQLLHDSLQRDKRQEALDVLELIREGVQESYDDVRELLVHFRTRVEHANLEAAIRSALEKFEGQTGIQTSFRQTGHGAPLPPENVIQVLHIIQEALSNVRKHARATQVDVELAMAGEYAITVRDNGRGFDSGGMTGAEAETHVGLKIMKERTHRIGGKLQVDSVPGAGTTVMLSLPKARTDVIVVET